MKWEIIIARPPFLPSLPHAPTKGWVGKSRPSQWRRRSTERRGHMEIEMSAQSDWEVWGYLQRQYVCFESIFYVNSFHLETEAHFCRHSAVTLRDQDRGLPDASQSRFWQKQPSLSLSFLRSLVLAGH